MSSATPPDLEGILAALDPEQRAVAANPRGPMVVLAGAGTGKTRAITHRIAYAVHSGLFAPTQVPLAVIEGILTVVIMIGLETYAKRELTDIGYLKVG